MMLMNVSVSPIHWGTSGPADEQFFNGNAQLVHKHAEQRPALDTSKDSLKVTNSFPPAR